MTFDAAGTLIRVRRPVGATYAELAGAHGIRLDPEAADHAFRNVFRGRAAPVYAGAPSDGDAAERAWWREIVADVARRCGTRPSPAAFDAFFTDAFAFYAAGAAWELFDDAVPALDALQRAGLRLAVVSNFDRRLRSVLAELRIAPYFDAVVLSADTGAAKPAPEIFRAAAAALDVAPQACLHVGDDPIADWHGARRAGMSAFKLQRPERGLAALAAAARTGRDD